MIVGGGPAGISTWLHLQRYAPELAEKTILIEKEYYPRDKLCGGALSGWSDKVFQQLGLDIDVPCVWIDYVECRLGTDADCLHQPRFFRVVRRKDFDQALAKNAIKRGITLRQGETFINFRRKNDVLEVKTDQNCYRTKILIGADGSLSNVRKTMQLKHSANLASTIEVFAPTNPRFDPEFNEKKIVFDYTSLKEGLQGYIWHFPCIDNSQAFMNHGIGDFHLDKNQPKANIKEIFREELEKRQIHRPVNTWSGYPIRWLSEGELVSQPNILLVGDASGIDPLLGGGIHLALSYGDLAATAIMDAFKNNDFSFHDYRNRIDDHIVGKYIKKLTYLAGEIYNEKISPLKVIREIFSKK